MGEIHPKLKSFIEVFYGNNKNVFLKEYYDLIGEELNLEKPSAGIIKFIRLKWGLSSDVLLGLDFVIKNLKNKKFKNLKKNSNAYAYASSLYKFIKFLIDQNQLIANELDFRSRINNPKEDAEKFIDFYGLNKSSINTFKSLKKVLEERDIYVFAFPIDTDKQEGIIYTISPSFIILNSNIKKIKSGFALAHEIGHFLYKNIEDEVYEEKLANQFATYLIIPSSLSAFIEDVFFRIKRERNKVFAFIKEICECFDCNLHPNTVIERLFLDEVISKEEKRKWKEEISKLENILKKRNSKARWEQKFNQNLGIIISDRYKEAIENLIKADKINQVRASEMLFERIANA